MVVDYGSDTDSDGKSCVKLDTIPEESGQVNETPESSQSPFTKPAIQIPPSKTKFERKSKSSGQRRNEGEVVAGISVSFSTEMI